MKGEKPPAPTRGLAAGGGDADDDEDEVDADDKDDDKIDDSLPRTDIRYPPLCKSSSVIFKMAVLSLKDFKHQKEKFRIL